MSPARRNPADSDGSTGHAVVANERVTRRAPDSRSVLRRFTVKCESVQTIANSFDTFNDGHPGGVVERFLVEQILRRALARKQGKGKAR